MHDENTTNIVHLEHRTPQETIKYFEKELFTKTVELRIAVAQYNEVVKQNRSLQRENNIKNLTDDELYSLFEKVIDEMNFRKNKEIYAIQKNKRIEQA